MHSFRCIVAALLLTIPCLAEDAELQSEVEDLKEQVELLTRVRDNLEEFEKDPVTKSTEALLKLGAQPEQLELYWTLGVVEQRRRNMLGVACRVLFLIAMLALFVVPTRYMWKMSKVLSGPTNSRPVWMK